MDRWPSELSLALAWSRRNFFIQLSSTQPTPSFALPFVRSIFLERMNIVEGSCSSSSSMNHQQEDVEKSSRVDGTGRQIVKFDEPEKTPSDPSNPRAWSKSYKWLCLMVLNNCSLCVTMTSSVISLSYGGIKEDFGIGQEVATLGLSLFVLGLSLGEGYMWFFHLWGCWGRREHLMAPLTYFAFLVRRHLSSIFRPSTIRSTQWILWQKSKSSYEEELKYNLLLGRLTSYLSFPAHLPLDLRCLSAIGIPCSVLKQRSSVLHLSIPYRDLWIGIPFSCWWYRLGLLQQSRNRDPYGHLFFIPFLWASLRCVTRISQGINPLFSNTELFLTIFFPRRSFYRSNLGRLHQSAHLLEMEFLHGPHLECRQYLSDLFL